MKMRTQVHTPDCPGGRHFWRRCKCIGKAIPPQAAAAGSIIRTDQVRVIETSDTDTNWSHVGRVLTPSEAADETGLDGYALEQAPMLRLRTKDGATVYPAFQFEHGHVADGVDEILTILPEGSLNRWALAAWLIAPSSTLGWKSPIELLRSGDAASKAQVIDHVHNWAAHLT